MPTYVWSDKDPHWNAEAPVSTWQLSMIRALAGTLIKVAREGNTEQRLFLRHIGHDLIYWATPKSPPETKPVAKPQHQRQRSTRTERGSD